MGIKFNNNEDFDQDEESRLDAELEKSMQEFFNYCGITKEEFDKGVEKQKRLRTYRKYKIIADSLIDFISGDITDVPEGYIVIKKTEESGCITCISIEDKFPSIIVEWSRTKPSEEMTRKEWEFHTFKLSQTEIANRIIENISEIQKNI